MNKTYPEIISTYGPPYKACCRKFSSIEDSSDDINPGNSQKESTFGIAGLNKTRADPGRPP